MERCPERELEKARTEGRAEDERWHMRKDGSRFWASGFVRPVVDEEENLIGFSKVARDLTERKRAEETLGEVRLAERERLARDLHDLVLQDLVYALQVGQAYRETRKEDEGEGLFDLREMIPSPPRARRCACGCPVPPRISARGATDVLADVIGRSATNGRWSG